MPPIDRITRDFPQLRRLASRARPGSAAAAYFADLDAALASGDAGRIHRALRAGGVA